MELSFDPRERCLTVAEVADRLSINTDTVRRLFLNETGVIVLCIPRRVGASTARFASLSTCSSASWPGSPKSPDQCRRRPCRELGGEGRLRRSAEPIGSSLDVLAALDECVKGRRLLEQQAIVNHAAVIIEQRGPRGPVGHEL